VHCTIFANRDTNEVVCNKDSADRYFGIGLIRIGMWLDDPSHWSFDTIRVRAIRLSLKGEDVMSGRGSSAVGAFFLWRQTILSSRDR
jgi:hypothetical protein